MALKALPRGNFWATIQRKIGENLIISSILDGKYLEGGVLWAQQIFGCLRDFLHIICLLLKNSGFVLEPGARSQFSLLGQKDVKPVTYFNISMCQL